MSDPSPLPQLPLTQPEPPKGFFPLDSIDSDAVRVIRKLRDHGHEAYLVGGCVRDLYLQRKPKDFDVATSATPEDIRKLFRNSRIIGRRFKLVHVFFGPKIIETSTFRTAPTTSGQDDLLILHDNEWGNVEDDARRRDFTINGLFYDLGEHSIVDFVDGLSDLDDSIIRTIGDPEVRFQEDPVRMIRAVKFAARLDFTIEEQTWQALIANVEHIRRCSTARVVEEFYKLMRSGTAQASFELLLRSQLIFHIIPDYIDLSSQQQPSNEPFSALFWRLLAALDKYVVGTRQMISNGVLLAILMVCLIGDEWIVTPRHVLEQKLEELMTKVLTPFGVAKRDREFTREILMAYRQMMGKSHRRRPSNVQRQYFHDALVFLGLWVQARGEEDSEFQRWQQLAAQVEASSSTSGPSQRKHPSRRRTSSGRSRSNTRRQRSQSALKPRATNSN